MRIADYFLDAAGRRPDAVAFVDGAETVSYRAARAQVLRIAFALSRHAEAGRPLHVAILSPNDHRVLLLQLAINHGDHVWLSLHARNSASAQVETLRDLDCDILFFHSAFEPMAGEIAAALPEALRAICIDRASALGPSMDAWLGEAGEAALPGPEHPLGSALIQPTGGTTGPSKAVIHTHRSIEMALLALRRSFAITERSAYLAVAPLTHAGGVFALGVLCAGGRVVVLPSFAADAIFEAIPAQCVSHLFLPPTGLYALLAHPRIGSTDFSSLRCFVTGAAPCAPDKFKEAVQRFGPVIYESYGQSESLFPILCKTPGDYLKADGGFDDAVLASAGRPVDCARIAIMDDLGQLLAPGENGEIVVRSSMVMAGYYKRPEETAAVSAFGWHHTTDVGSMDERGFVTIRDRKKDMIVSGGFNLYPSEIEAVIATHPAVLECSVIGVPDPKWGEAVKAVVELKADARASEEEIIALCKAELGSLKAPKSVEFWPALPRSAVGKVLKKDIRARFWVGEWRAV
jgi:acyl-CoA synthetase (AMP-forming)/AMP-acid ligase II